MKKQVLTEIIVKAISFFTKEWMQEYGELFQEEILEEFTNNLVYFYTNGVPKQLVAPFFNEEVTPLLNESFSFFKPILQRLEANDYQATIAIQKEMVSVLETVDFKHVLLLLGQRVTSATVQDARGIPPLQKNILEASFQPYNHQLSKAVRAFEKHTERSENNFWGAISGSPSAKEEKVKEIVSKMLVDKSWWNIFYHFKHELVYEIRIPSGHGARWKKSNLEFIGFVEPFLNEK